MRSLILKVMWCVTRASRCNNLASKLFPICAHEGAAQARTCTPSATPQSPARMQRKRNNQHDCEHTAWVVMVLSPWFQLSAGKFWLTGLTGREFYKFEPRRCLSRR